MDDMTAGRWRYTQAYLAEVFGVEDEAAAEIRRRSERSGAGPDRRPRGCREDS